MPRPRWQGFDVEATEASFAPGPLPKQTHLSFEFIPPQEEECHCEQFADQFHTNEQGHVVKTPDGSGKWINWACARALRYTFTGGASWSDRVAYNAVYHESYEGCGDLPNPVDWFFDPSEGSLQSYLDLMTTPPTSGDYEVTFYFSTDRWRVALGPPGAYGWYGTEADSGVHLMAICYKSI